MGIDLCAVGRMRAALARFGDRLLTRCFTEAERAHCLARPDPAPCLAARFAAKEAAAKALGTGLGAALRWREVEVVAPPKGPPALRLTGAAAARWGGLRWHLSLTHERDLAAAVAVAEAAGE